MNLDQFLSRIPNHPKADVAKAAVAEFAKVANEFVASKTSLKSGNRLTPEGVNAALRDAIPGYAARLAAARKPIDAMAKEAKARRVAMKPKAPEASNLSAAIERQEIRQWLRDMNPGDRMQALTATTDRRVLQAALTAPMQLSGITDKDSADRIEAHWLDLAHADEMAQVQELEQLANEATAAALVARGELRMTAEMDEVTFTSIAGPAESKALLPWLVDNGGKAMVVEVDAVSGLANYRPATEWEAKAGVYADPAAA